MNKESIISKIQAALESIRPHLLIDGGDVEFVELTDDMIANIRLLGACESCSMSVFTMQTGIEESIKRMAPEVKEVIAVNEVSA